MSAQEKVLQICKEKGIAVSKLERDLGFSNGYIKGLKSGKISAERVRMIGDYLTVPYYEIDDEIFPRRETYYLNDETAQIAQDIFENPDLRALFSASRNQPPENLQLAAEMLKRMKATNPEG